MSPVSALAIARVAYEAMRVYGWALGEATQPEWEDAPARRHNEAIAGVEAVLRGEARSGAHLHEIWIKRAATILSGGRFAPGYHDLRIDQRRKVLLFRAVVLALVDGPCNGFCHDDRCANYDDHACHLETCMSRFGIPPGAFHSQAGPEPGSAGGPPAPATKLYC